MRRNLLQLPRISPLLPIVCFIILVALGTFLYVYHSEISIIKSKQYSIDDIVQVLKRNGVPLLNEWRRSESIDQDLRRFSYNLPRSQHIKYTAYFESRGGISIANIDIRNRVRTNYPRTPRIKTSQTYEKDIPVINKSELNSYYQLHMIKNNHFIFAMGDYKDLKRIYLILNNL
jgi:hypothetical protein